MKPRGTYIDVKCYDGDVFEVEGGVDLVHEIQRGGFVVVKGKHQGQGAQGLLSS